MDRKTQELIKKKERFSRGESDDAYTFMGAHPSEDGKGWIFRVWAPKAKSVHLVGDFNFWNTEELAMQKDPHGIWEIKARYAKEGSRYQYLIEGADGKKVYKSDPYAYSFAALPDTASVIKRIDGLAAVLSS